MHKIYYSDTGYWTGKNAVVKLSKAAKVDKNVAEKWLLKQPLYQIYLPAPKYIPRANASHSTYLSPNAIHQADLLYLPHDKGFKYALCVVDVASRFKTAKELKGRTAKEVSEALKYIYDHTPLNFPDLMIIDGGKEFQASFKKLLKNHDTSIQIGVSHRSTGIVERFNQTLSKKLFAYQYFKEFTGRSNREWVDRLQNVVKAINNEKTRLIDMKPIDAIKLKKIKQGFAAPIKDDQKLIDLGQKVRYLYSDGELEGDIYHGDKHKRATDPVWSVDVHTIVKSIIKKGQPVLYHLNDVKRSFVSEELQLFS